jgi:hypothetical protein
MAPAPSKVTVEPGSVRPGRRARNGQTGLVNGVWRLNVGPTASRVMVRTTGRPTSPQSLIGTTWIAQRLAGRPSSNRTSSSDSDV